MKYPGNKGNQIEQNIISRGRQKYFPYTVKMYKGVVKITITVWAEGNVEAGRMAKEKYEGFEIMIVQAQWHYKNRLIAI